KGDSGEVTLVDTGVGVTTADERKLRGYVNPVEVVKRIGVDGSNVTKVVISHMHWDHVGGMEMFPQAFPKATFYVQKREYEFWVKHPVAKRKFMKTFADDRANKITADLEGTNRLVLVQGDLNIGPASTSSTRRATRWPSTRSPSTPPRGRPSSRR